MTSVEDELVGLELRLLDTETRRRPDRVDALLDDDFFEFGASGAVYDRRRTLAALVEDPTDPGEPVDLDVRLLSPEVALVTYRLAGEPPSNRCSVWRGGPGRWRMVFHQGTPAVGQPPSRPSSAR